jgi:hypothetical protein
VRLFGVTVAFNKQPFTSRSRTASGEPFDNFLKPSSQCKGEINTSRVVGIALCPQEPSAGPGGKGASKS